MSQKSFVVLTALDKARHQHPFFKIILPLDDLFQFALNLRQLNIRQKTKGTDIDPADGNVPLVKTAADSQQRPVSPDAERHVNGMVFDILHPVRLIVKKFGAVHRHQQFDVLPLVKIYDAPQHHGGIFFVNIGKYRDHQHCRLSFGS